MSKYHDKQREQAQAQRLYAATKDPNAAPAVTFTNFTTQQTYTGIKMNCARAGAGELSPNGRPA